MTTIRRFATALRSAQWGHVLLELTLIVLGILIALAVDSWMDDRRDARLERQYLELLERDLTQDLTTLDDTRRFEQSQVDASVLVYRGLRLGVAPEEREAVATALGQLTYRRTLRLRRATYINLLSTGHLRLLRNAELRDQVVRMYENGERTQAIRDRNNQEFVDRLYVTYLLDQNLVTPRPAITLAGTLDTDKTFAKRIDVPARVEDDRLWTLTPDAPSVRVLANRVWYRGSASTAALQQTAVTEAEIREVRQAIQRELSGRSWP